MLQVMVTGANGFVGRHLIHELKSRGHEVIGVGHGGELDATLQSSIRSYHQCDLSDPKQTAELPLEQIDAVINLAGLARTGASFHDAEKYKRINVAILQTIGKRLSELRSHARLIAVSTGAVYDANQPLPLSETSKTVADGSPYALSKLMMEQTARDLRKRGVQCIVARPFNHAGPGQALGFLIPDLFAHLQEAKQTGRPIRAGDLATKRDYTDVRDIAKAYADLAASEILGFDLYNICSGTSRSGQEILDVLLQQLDLVGSVQVEVDQALIRPNDPPDLYGSYERIREETGWEPIIPIEQTIADFIADKS